MIASDTTHQFVILGSFSSMRAQGDEADGLVIDALGNPAEHAGPVSGVSAPRCGWTNHGLPEVVPMRGSLSIRCIAASATQNTEPAGPDPCPACRDSLTTAAGRPRLARAAIKVTSNPRAASSTTRAGANTPLRSAAKVWPDGGCTGSGSGSVSRRPSITCLSCGPLGDQRQLSELAAGYGRNPRLIEVRSSSAPRKQSRARLRRGTCSFMF